MNSVKFLYAAYVATWLIHGLYLGSLVRRYRALRQRIKEVSAASRFPPPASGKQK